jgi:hypothetical protein
MNQMEHYKYDDLNYQTLINQMIDKYNRFVEWNNAVIDYEPKNKSAMDINGKETDKLKEVGFFLETIFKLGELL